MIRALFFVFTSGMVWTHSFGPYHVPLGSSVWGYFAPPVLKRPQHLHTPMEAMVDLTNRLGVAILQDHSFSRGNYAFSPYGVASVLVVVFEGAGGESANQIRRAVGFPSNKDVLRMGFRDIHRHLRSYFSHEGFLSGITLNKNGSSLKPEYKTILKYYGYDVDLSVHSDDDSKVDQDAKTSTQGPETTKGAVTTTPQANTEIITLTTSNEEMDIKNVTTTGKPEEPINTEKVSRGNDTPTTSSITTMKETLPTTKKVSTGDDSESEAPTSVDLKEEEVLPTTENVSADDKTTAVTESTTESTADEPITTETEKAQEKTDFSMKVSDSEEMKQPTTQFSESVTNEPEIPKPDESKEMESDEKETIAKEQEVKELGGKPESDGTNLDNGMLIPQPSEEPTTTDWEKTTTEVSFSEPTTDVINSGEPSEELTRQKSIRATGKVKLIPALKPNNDGWEKQLRKMFDSKASIWAYEPRKKRKRTQAERHRRTIADYLKWPLNPDLSLQLQNGMYDTHVSRNAEMYRSLPRLMFLVDGALDTPVPMMTYTNVFPYGYIPKLHAKALEFPLDDIRYKLLIVLPVERRGLRQLIYDLADFPVRDVLKCLQPTRVKAVIPTFMVEGFVILTSSLQKLGIWDVFDPRKANLSGMSVDPELYVRNIEQSVTVVIRNYVEILDIQTPVATGCGWGAAEIPEIEELPI